MDILTIILLSLGSLIALFILTKLMGYRQMSEMSMFDYINGISKDTATAVPSNASFLLIIDINLL